jgi:energy-coupling factor transporter transmembrane protein EcfT
MEAIKGLEEFIELSYLADRPKRKIFSEADAAFLAISCPFLVVLSKGAFFPSFVISLSLVLAITIGESLSRFIKSSLFFIPLFSLAIALPRAFWDPGFGLYGAVVFTLRVWGALSIPSLLTRSYGLPYISYGLASIRIPEGFAYLIMMTSIDAISMARFIWSSSLAFLSRGVPKLRLKDLGYFFGYQLVRGYERGERMNMAFISRGGGNVGIKRSKITKTSMLILAILLAAFFIAIEI